MTDDPRLAALAERKRAHSIFAPSSAHRWTVCEGSLVANALAEDTTSFYAAEGTVAHSMADQWLRTGQRPPLQTVVEDGYEIVVDNVMLSYVEQYVEWVQDCRGKMYFESRVDFSPVTPIPHQTGTADHFSATFGELTITDLKYGKGLRVDAEDNPQLLLYALGVFLEWDWYYGFEKIVIRVCQPRLDHFPTFTVDRQRLLDFADWIRDRATAAWRVDAPRTPGEHCTHCKVIGDCPAYLTWFAAHREIEIEGVFDTAGFTVAEMAAAAERAEDPFADDPIPLPELSVDAWCRILGMRGAVEAWFAAGEARVFSAASAGIDTPGWKLVEGRSNRVWSDPDAAQARMVEVGIPLEETVTSKLKSPNQVEEQLHASTGMRKKAAAELFESLVERKPGDRSLVRASDRREAVESHGSVFDTE